MNGGVAKVAVVLAIHADDRGVCWVGREKIGALTGLNVGTVSHAIAKLLDVGVIERRRRYGKSAVTILANVAPAPHSGQQECRASATSNVAPAPHRMSRQRHNRTIQKNHPEEPSREEREYALPDDFKTPELEAALEDWLQHLRELNRTPGRQAMNGLLKKLVGWGAARSIAAIRHSISSNYFALYEPQNSTHKTGRNNGHAHASTGQYAESIKLAPRPRGGVR
jgi:DNA-binding transcriptional ArsR family regulator